MNAKQTLDGFAAAKSLERVVMEGAAECEAQRTLPQSTVDAVWESGLMQWMNAEAAGGSEPSMLEMLDVWQELARQDGSMGWLSIANFPSASFASAYLPDAGFEEVFSKNNDRVTVAGQFAPNGMGEKVEGGYKVNGKWNFGSGTGHSEYVVGGFIPLENGEMSFREDGMPVMLVAVFPRSEINFTDGWHVTGLKGTGSYDYNVEDVFVPERRAFPLITREPLRGGAMFKMGIMPVTGAGHAAWALGVARGALDDILKLANEKTRMGDPATLGNKLTFQKDLAHHESAWRAARLLVVDAFCRNVDAVAGGADLTLDMRAEMRMAATYATEVGKEVCHFAHLAAGTTAIRLGSRLERAFRDMYTGSQHAFINEKTYTDSAQVMLGLLEEAPGL